jgi:WD40 repeat protein
MTTPGASAAPPVPASSFYVAGGTLPPEAPSYLPRHADEELFDALRAGEFCYVLNARQMGKSSLCVRTMRRLRAAGVRTVFLDLTRFGSGNLTPEQWYAALLSELGRELGVRAEMLRAWKEQEALPPVQRLFEALTEVALPAAPAPLVLFIDEIDVTRSLPFSTDEFFAALRQLHVGRATDPRLKQLSVCLLGTAAPGDLIEDPRITPFNVGRRVEVRDFTAAEATPLAEGLGSGGGALLGRVLYWTDGHPYLTQRLCQAALEEGAKRPADVDRLVERLFLTPSAREADDNLAVVRNRLLKYEGDLTALLTLYGEVRAGRTVRDDETDPLQEVLKLSGVVKLENGVLRVRNRIYAAVFEKRWVVSQLPGAELRRQREAYRRGLLRAGALAAIVIALVGGLAIYAFQQATLARRSAESARRSAEAADLSSYAANLNLMRLQWESSNFGQVMELLKETRDNRARGWEWGYWDRLCHLDLLTLRGHTMEVTAAGFSPDGRRLVTASYDGTARLWDAATGRELRALKGHFGAIFAAAISPDGRRVATGSSDETVRVWNPATGREVLALMGPNRTRLTTGEIALDSSRQGLGLVRSVAFSPDGRRLVTASDNENPKVWDVATGREVLTLKPHSARVSSAAFSPDGRRLITAGDLVPELWDAATGRTVLTLKGHSEVVYSAAFSPDGRRVITASGDKTAKVWGAVTGRELLTLRGHTRRLSSAVFSADSRRVVTASADGTARVWDAASGRELLTLKGHRGPLNSAAFSPDGRRVITASGDQTAKVWDAVTGRECLTIKGPGDQVAAAAFSPDGRRVVIGRYATPKICDAATGRELLTLKGHGDWVHAVAFSPDGRRVGTVSLDKTARLWDAATGRQMLMMTLEGDQLRSVAFSPNGRRLLTAGNNETPQLWDASTGREVLALKGHTEKVNAAAFSPDGQRVVTAGQDGTARVWDAATGRALLTFKGHDNPVYGAAFSPDGRWVASASIETAKVWDAATGREVLTLKGHGAWVSSAGFSPDGRRVVTASFDGTAKLWDAASGRELLTLSEHGAGVYSAVFSPDGRRLLTVGDDGSAKIWFSRLGDGPEGWQRPPARSPVETRGAQPAPPPTGGGEGGPR